MTRGHPGSSRFRVVPRELGISNCDHGRSWRSRGTVNQSLAIDLRPPGKEILCPVQQRPPFDEPPPGTQDWLLVGASRWAPALKGHVNDRLLRLREAGV